jgi:hypothetical protein
MRVLPGGRRHGQPYWVAQDKDGTLYYFGGTSGIEATSLVCDATCDRIFRWNLVRVRGRLRQRVIRLPGGRGPVIPERGQGTTSTRRAAGISTEVIVDHESAVDA